MIIRRTVLAAAIGIAALITAPVQAGGPVITEEPPRVEAATEDGRIPGWVVPVGIVLLVAILSGSDTCNQDETPEPTPGGCQ